MKLHEVADQHDKLRRVASLVADIMMDQYKANGGDVNRAHADTLKNIQEISAPAFYRLVRSEMGFK